VRRRTCDCRRYADGALVALTQFRFDLRARPRPTCPGCSPSMTRSPT
jgi:hypothetical protein